MRALPQAPQRIRRHGPMTSRRQHHQAAGQSSPQCAHPPLQARSAPRASAAARARIRTRAHRLVRSSLASQTAVVAAAEAAAAHGHGHLARRISSRMHASRIAGADPRAVDRGHRGHRNRKRHFRPSQAASVLAAGARQGAECNLACPSLCATSWPCHRLDTHA